MKKKVSPKLDKVDKRSQFFENLKYDLLSNEKIYHKPNLKLYKLHGYRKVDSQSNSFKKAPNSLVTFVPSIV